MTATQTQRDIYNMRADLGTADEYTAKFTRHFATHNGQVVRAVTVSAAMWAGSVADKRTGSFWSAVKSESQDALWEKTREARRLAREARWTAEENQE